MQTPVPAPRPGLRLLGAVAVAAVLALAVWSALAARHEGPTAQARQQVRNHAVPATQPSPPTPPATRAVPLAFRPAPAAGLPVASAGLRVARDPETGELGTPTPEQLKELGVAPAALDHSAEGLEEVHHPDGSVSIDLQGRFMEYSVARVGPDGKPHLDCVHGAKAAERALSDTTRTASGPEEK
jgi:hypothetical protein